MVRRSLRLCHHVATNIVSRVMTRIHMDYRIRARWATATGIRGPNDPQPEWLEMVAGIADGHDRYNDVCQLSLILMSHRYWYRFVLASWADADSVIEVERMEPGRSITLALRGFARDDLAYAMPEL